MLQRLPRRSWHGNEPAGAKRLARGARFEHGLQLANVHWFHEMMIETRSLRLALVALLSPAAQSNEHNAFAPRLLADASPRLNAVQPGHADIEQYDIGPKVGTHLQALQPVVGAARLIAFEAKQSCKACRCVTVVVDHEDAMLRSCRK